MSGLEGKDSVGRRPSTAARPDIAGLAAVGLPPEPWNFRFRFVLRCCAYDVSGFYDGEADLPFAPYTAACVDGRRPGSVFLPWKSPPL